MVKRIKLDERLRILLGLIQRWTPPDGTHLDVGSDHGGLLQHLCQSGHIRAGIAVEKRAQPFRNSQAALQNFPVDIRLGDGLEPVAASEYQSLSISGMGGRTMVEILTQTPAKLPRWFFLQPNKDPDQVRSWAFATKFHLVEEHLTEDLFILMAFEASSTPDPIYETFQKTGDPHALEAAWLFGPRLILDRNSTLKKRLREELQFYGKMPRQTAITARRLKRIEAALGQM